MPQISITGGTSAENFSQFMTFTVRLSEAALDAVAVSYRTLLGTAREGDLDARSTSNQHNGQVVFAPGETVKTINVEADSDSSDEVDESVIVELYNPVGADFGAGNATLRAFGVIEDNDGVGPDLAVFVSSPTIIEADSGQRLARFEVELSDGADVTLSYSTIDITAIAGSDYVAQSGTLAFSGNQTKAFVDVPIIGDLVAEPSELFALTVTPPTNPVVSTRAATGVATILDTDTSSLPEVSLAGGVTDESFSHFMRFVVTLSEPSLDAVTINYRTLGGTANNLDLDATLTSSQHNGSITFAPGETSKSIFIEADSDDSDEVDENVTLELFQPTGAVFPTGNATMRADGIVLDNDGFGSNLAVFVGDPVLIEGDNGTTLATFEITLSQPRSTAITMDYATADISAVAGQDYEARSGQITFTAGQTIQAVTVPIIGDLVGEETEAFALTVTPPTEIVVATTGATGIATILDTDTTALPEISITGDSTIESFSNLIRFVISLSKPSLDAVSVNYRTLNGTAINSDLDATTTSNQHNGTVVFAPGELTKSILVEADSDDIDERDEFITVELFDPNGGAFPTGQPVLRAQGIIEDNDGVGSNFAVIVSDPVITEANSAETFAGFDIQLTEPRPTEFTLTYRTADVSAKAGEDYVATSGTVTFAPGQTLARVNVPVLGDTVGEAAETFVLLVDETAFTAGTAGHAKILDTDTSILPELSVEGDVTIESFSNFIRFVVTLSEASLNPVEVNWASIAGTVEAADLDNGFQSGTLTFAPGETSKSILIEADSDGADERDETVFLRLTDPVGAVFPSGQGALFAEGFILDNDGVGPNRSISALPAILAEEGIPSATYEIEVQLSSRSAAELVFDVALANGTGTVGDDIRLLQDTVTFAPGQLTASIPVEVLRDAEAEVDETVSLILSPAIGTPFVGTIGTVDLTITNGAPLISGDANNNTIFGTAADEIILAEDGFDWVVPGRGNDTVDGGNGRDMVSYSDLVEVAGRGTNFLLTLDLEAGTANVFGGEMDQLISVERATGSIYADLMRGTSGNDELRGIGDYDWFIATEGNDTLNGGNGLDMVTFLEAGFSGAPVIQDIFSTTGSPPTGADVGGVLLDLSNPANNTGLAQGLTLISVERVTGSSHQDVFFGDGAQNDFRGLGGFDWFVGSTGGRERYFGGDGIDTVTYFQSSAGVIASLRNGAGEFGGQETGFGSAGDAIRDLYFEIENLVGTNFGDRLEGNRERNNLSGLDGDDFLLGYGGIDYLKGGLGNDTLDGGASSDFALFDGNRADYTLTRTSATEVTVIGADGTDNLINVEYFEFDDGQANIWELSIV